MCKLKKMVLSEKFLLEAYQNKKKKSKNWEGTCKISKHCPFIFEIS